MSGWTAQEDFSAACIDGIMLREWHTTGHHTETPIWQRGNTAYSHHRLPRFLLSSATIIMSQYPVPPPSYGSTSPPPKSPNLPIYSGVSYRDEPGSSAGIYNQPAPDDLPDDFKVGPPPFQTLAFFDPLDSMVSLLPRVPLRSDLPLSGKCTLSCVSLHLLPAPSQHG